MNAWWNWVDKELVDSWYTPAALKVLERFPFEPAGIELVAHSENVTYRVASRDGNTDYALRLHRAGYNSIEELESERIWTDALHRAGLPVPAQLLTRDEEPFVLVDIPAAGEQRYAGITTWLEGTPLCDYPGFRCGSERRVDYFHRIGEIVAAMHNQASRWAEPAGFVRQRLDLDGLLGESPRWGRFWECPALTNAERQSLLRARVGLRAALVDYGAGPDRFSLIHADVNPDNIVHNDGSLAVIDFDDAAYGWHLYEIASALLDDRHAADFDAVCAALLDGYCGLRPLADTDLETLPAFLLIRGMATIGWYHQRPEHARDDYFDDMKSWVIAECDSRGW